MFKEAFAGILALFLFFSHIPPPVEKAQSNSGCSAVLYADFLLRSQLHLQWAGYVS